MCLIGYWWLFGDLFMFGLVVFSEFGWLGLAGVVDYVMFCVLPCDLWWCLWFCGGFCGLVLD